MTNNKSGVHRVWLRLAGVMLSGMCLTPMAIGANEEDGLASEQAQVRELMRLETGQLLVRARHGRSDTADSLVPRKAVAMQGTPVLAAIYGVDRSLLAEVDLDGQRFLYQRGQALPVGVAPGDDVYILQDMTSSCVRLSRADASHSLCLARTMGAAP